MCIVAGEYYTMDTVHLKIRRKKGNNNGRIPEKKITVTRIKYICPFHIPGYTYLRYTVVQ